MQLSRNNAKALELSSMAQGIEDTFGDLSPPDIKRLASLGAYGNNPSSAQRDMKKSDFLDTSSFVSPDPFTVQAWVLNHSGGHPSLETAGIDIFLPHEWLQTLHKNGYLDSFIGTAKDCRAFWDQVSPNYPKLHHNPMMKVKGWQDLFNPFVTHADKGPHTKQDSIHAISMYSLNAVELHAGIDFSTLLLCAIPNQCIATKSKCKDLGFTWKPEMEETLETIGMYLAWSFNALFDGRAGTRDPAGNHYGKSGTIAGGARCILWQAPADCEHLSVEYGLPNYNSLKPCMRCCCDRDACPWDDWSDHAKFLQTAYQPSDLLKAPLTRHWLLTIKGTSHFIFPMT